MKSTTLFLNSLDFEALNLQLFIKDGETSEMLCEKIQLLVYSRK
jgi:hypothetical protein